MEYNKLRKFSNDVYVLKFPKNKYRIGLTFGNYSRLDNVSNNYGTPELDELCAGRINCGFFQWERKNADGTYAQYMSKHLGGAFDGDEMYRNAVSQNDFHDVYMTKDGTVGFTDIRTDEQASYYDSTTVWNMGISFSLIENGKKATYIPPSMKAIHNGRHVRSAVGVDKYGDFFFVVVGTRGVTGDELKTIMFDLGCVDAFNCDGGGSSTIKMYDTTLNVPTDGQERLVGTVMCAYEKYDYRELPVVSIGRNNRGVYAELLQRLLVYLEYGEQKDIDGAFGSTTDRMVRNFQRDYKLDIDGIVGQGTWGKLMAVVFGATEEEKEKEFLIFSDQDKFKEWLDSQNVQRRINTIQQHNTFKPDYNDWAVRKDEQSYMRGLKSWGTVNMGWRDAPQHFLVFPNGNIGIGRTLEWDPAGIMGANANSICIEHFGYFDKGYDIMTNEQEDASLFLNACLCIKFGLEPSVNTLIYHHWYDLNTGERKNGAGITKSCPGTNFFCGNKIKDAETCFIPQVKSYIRKIAGEKEVMDIGIVSASSLNVRSSPNASSRILGTLSNGQEVEIYSETGSWYEINYSGSVAYVHSGWIDIKDIELEVEEIDYEERYNLLLKEYNQLYDEYYKLLDELLDDEIRIEKEVEGTFSEFMNKILGIFKKR